MVGFISGVIRSLDDCSYEAITWKGKYRSTLIPIMCTTIALCILGVRVRVEAAIILRTFPFRFLLSIRELSLLLAVNPKP